MVHSFVTSRVDYCNSVLASAPKNVTVKLQRVQNAAARLIAGTQKHERVFHGCCVMICAGAVQPCRDCSSVSSGLQPLRFLAKLCISLEENRYRAELEGTWQCEGANCCLGSTGWPKNGTIFDCLNFIKYLPVLKLFHRQNKDKSCNNDTIKLPPHPECVATLPCEMSAS